MYSDDEIKLLGEQAEKRIEASARDVLLNDLQKRLEKAVFFAQAHQKHAMESLAELVIEVRDQLSVDELKLSLESIRVSHESFSEFVHSDAAEMVATITRLSADDGALNVFLNQILRWSQSVTSRGV